MTRHDPCFIMARHRLIQMHQCSVMSSLKSGYSFMFRSFYAQKVLCSEGSMFRSLYRKGSNIPGGNDARW